VIRRCLSVFRRVRAKTALVLPLLLAACPDNKGPGIIVQPTSTVTSVSVSPGTGAILVGATTTFVASVVTTGTAANTVTWTSSNTAIATVNASGNTVTVTGAGAGSATITATSSFDATKSGSATVTVTAPQTIVLTPSARTFAATSGGALPASQTVAVTASSGTINGLLATVSTQSGGNWLSASFTPTSTPSTFTLSANTTALAAGTYTGTVTIGAPGISTSAVINVTYTVSGSTVAACNTTTGVTTVSLGQSVDGALASTDCRVGGGTGAFGDVYRLVLGATTVLQVDLSTDSTVAPTNTFLTFDANVILLDANGAVIASDDDGGIMTNSQLTRTLAAGTYFIMATSFAAGETGGYTLMVSASGAAGGMCAPANAVALTIGVTTAGALANTDCFGRRRLTVGAGPGRPFGDLYRFTRTTTNTMTFTMTAAGFDTFLRLLDSDLILLSEDDDGGGGTNSRISRSLPAGTYFVMATAFSDGATGAYSLSATATAAGANFVPVDASTLSRKERAALLRAAAGAGALRATPRKPQ
jgi:hypothetical protein